MKTKKLGTIVELDPNKKYIMLLDASVLTEEQVEQLADSKIRDGLIIYGYKIQEGVTFIENSDRIVEIRKKDV